MIPSSVPLTKQSDSISDIDGVFATQLHFYPHSNINAGILKPSTARPILTQGWQWVPTSWLYYWMLKNKPINNRCSLLNKYEICLTMSNFELREHCIYCPAGYGNRGDTIISLIDKFCVALVEGDANLSFYSTNDEGFDLLLARAKEQIALISLSVQNSQLALWRQSMDIPNPPTYESSDALSVMLGGSKLYIGAWKSSEIGIVNGRHRICAAYRFGVPELPVFVSM